MASATASPSSASGTGWTSPTNVAAADGSYASVSLAPAALSNPLVITGYSFAIPVGATILGVTVSPKGRFNTGDGAQLTQIQLVVGGSATGDQKGPQALTGTNTSYDIGGSADLWGLTPTVAQVNASDFGVQLRGQEIGGENSVNVDVDHVPITITYLEAGAIRRRTYTQALRGERRYS